MKKKMFYVIDIDDSFQVLVFRVKNYLDDGTRDVDTYDFYISDGEFLKFMTGLLCRDVNPEMFEDIAKRIFSSANWLVER